MSKQKPQLTKEMIQAFVMHPDWETMLGFIESHFENSADVNTINVDNPSSTVHAEVIATQKISADIKSLRDTFTNLKQGYGKSKQSYE